MVVVAGGRVLADGSATSIKARVSGRTIRFTCPDPRGDLAGLPGVSAVGGTGEQVELTSSDVEATLRALLAGPRPLPDLEVRGATLEQAFLHLIDPDGALR